MEKGHEDMYMIMNSDRTKIKTKFSKISFKKEISQFELLIDVVKHCVKLIHCLFLSFKI